MSQKEPLNENLSKENLNRWMFWLRPLIFPLGVLGLLITSVIAIWVFWVVYGIRAIHSFFEREMMPAKLAELGQVGDLFGGINALFAALACAGVFWAGYLQRKALLEAQKAYRDERDANAVDKLAITRQQFESSFFQLLALSRDITSRIDINLDANEICREQVDKYNGARALEYMATVVRGEKHYSDSIHTAHDANLTILKSTINRFKSKVYDRYPSVIGPYFRSLYQIFKLIDNAPDSLNERDKNHYANIARGQISEGAVLLLAVNGLSAHGVSFVKYINRYGLLEHMHPEYRQKFQPLFELIYQPHAFLGSKKRPLTSCLKNEGLRLDAKNILELSDAVWEC